MKSMDTGKCMRKQEIGRKLFGWSVRYIQELVEYEVRRAGTPIQSIGQWNLLKDERNVVTQGALVRIKCDDK